MHWQIWLIVKFTAVGYIPKWIIASSNEDIVWMKSLRSYGKSLRSVMRERARVWVFFRLRKAFRDSWRQWIFRKSGQWRYLLAIPWVAEIFIDFFPFIDEVSTNGKSFVLFKKKFTMNFHFKIGNVGGLWTMILSRCKLCRQLRIT